MLAYCTTNRDGYREYKSCGTYCGTCPYLHQCTGSKGHVKTVMRHVWEEDMEKAEDIRYTIGNKEIYQKRKETILTVTFLVSLTLAKAKIEKGTKEGLARLYA